MLARRMGSIGSGMRLSERRFGGRGFVVAATLVAVSLLAIWTSGRIGAPVSHVLRALGRDGARWLWLAVAGFSVAVVGSGWSWQAAIELCGGRCSLLDACARYGAGALVNTFVPARAGDAVRIALFARVLPDNDRRLRTSGGAYAALGAVRALATGLVVVAAAVAGWIPPWPLFLAGILVVAVAVVVLVARRASAHLLVAFRALATDRTAFGRLAAPVAVQTIGRLAAAASIAAALGIRAPVAAAVVIILALDLTGLVPLGPGNLGVTSGTIAVAFQQRGLPFTHGLAAGVAFHAVETAVGLAVGIASLLWLAPYPSPTIRRITLLAASAASCVALAGALGATVLASLL